MQVSQSKSSSKIPVDAAGRSNDVSEGQPDLLGTDWKPKGPEIEPSQQEGVSSTLCLPDVA